MSLRDIIRETAQDHGLQPEDITGSRRTRKIAHARQDAMWRARQVKREDGTHRYSATQIGNAVGRDHSTVFSGIEAHAFRVGLIKRKRQRQPRPKSPHPAWGILRRHLMWAYGPERTAAILSGNDPTTNADIAKWNDLGRAHERRAGL